MKFLVYGSIWVSLAVPSFVLSTYLSLDLSINWFLISFVFFSTLFIYNFQRVIRVLDTQSESSRIDWLKLHYKWMIGLTCIGAIGGLMCVFFLSFESILTYALLGVISVLYAAKFHKGNKGLRDLPYLKIYLIAFTWAITALMPILDNDFAVSFDDWLLLLLEKSCFILAITIPFDIRDLTYDAPEKRTIPQIFGAQRSTYIAVGLIGIHLILAAMINQTPLVYIALCMNGCVTAFLVLKSFPKQSENYYAFWIEGTPILQMILLALASII